MIIKCVWVQWNVPVSLAFSKNKWETYPHSTVCNKVSATLVGITSLSRIQNPSALVFQSHLGKKEKREIQTCSVNVGSGGCCAESPTNAQKETSEAGKQMTSTSCLNERNEDNISTSAHFCLYTISKLYISLFPHQYVIFMTVGLK